MAARIPPDDTAHIPVDDYPSASTMVHLFRVMAHRPTIMQHTMELLEAAMRTGTVEPQLKELIAVRVSQVNHCFY